MLSELIPLNFHKIMQTKAYTMIIMETNGKHFPIYVDSTIGHTIQTELMNIKTQRPQSHSLFNQILKGLNTNIIQIIINELDDTIYHARLFLEKKEKELTSIIEIDARPSDCILLAIMNEIPIYCTKSVIEKTLFIEEF